MTIWCTDAGSKWGIKGPQNALWGSVQYGSINVALSGTLEPPSKHIQLKCGSKVSLKGYNV
jgi:hypothetical protein